MNGELPPEQKAAHMRMIMKLGVRTHLGVCAERGQGKRIGTLPPTLIAEVQKLIAEGMTDQRICRRHRIGILTLRRIKDALG